MGAYALRSKDAPITASNMDFSKPFDDQINGQEESKVEDDDDDPRKEVMRFPTYCYACSQ